MASGHVTCLVQVLKCSLCQCARRMVIMVHGLIIFSSFVFETSTVGIVGRYSSRTKRRLAKTIQAGLWDARTPRPWHSQPATAAPCLQHPPTSFIGMIWKGMPSLPRMGSRMTKIAVLMTVRVVLMRIV